MLNIKNNDIRLRRGDTTNLSLSITDINGVPYILPVFDNIRYLNIVNVIASISSVYKQIFIDIWFDVNIFNNVSKISIDWDNENIIVINSKTIRVTVQKEDYRKVLNNWVLTCDEQRYLIVNGFEWLVNNDSVDIILGDNYNKLLIGQKVYNAFIGMSIKDGPEGNIVYENFLDMNNSPAWFKDSRDNVYIKNAGYTAFTSQAIKETTVTDLQNNYKKGIDEVGIIENNYVCIVDKVTSTGINYSALYEFNIGFQINAEDTLKLDLQNYLYEICLYIGEQDFDEVDKLPLKNIAYKQTLVPASTIVVEDSING